MMQDPYNGTWTISLDESSVWDAASKSYVPDEVGEEVITFRIEDGVQEYEVLYGDSPRFRIGYTARYDAAEWVDYSVREIVATTDDLEEEIRSFKNRIRASGEASRQLEVGKPYGFVRLVYINPAMHYRISRNPLGTGPSIILRNMSSDEKSYITHLMDASGVVYRIRKFIRVD
jgi:hypothetical protein